MADREKIIKALECCSRPAIRECKECPYESYCYHDSLCDIAIHDALNMLKEQSQMYYTLEHDWRMCRELLKEQEERIKTLESLRRIEQEGR